MHKSNKRIVISISSPYEQGLIIEYLAPLGYEILTYQEEGWIQADLFILDSKSASEIGQQVLDLKQKVDTFLPVLIILSKDDDLDFWLDTGFDDYLLMPISHVQLKAKVGLLLRLKEQSEKLIQKNESIYQSIFEAIGTATLIVDEDTSIIMANQTCSQVTGYSPEELIGTSWTKYVTTESLEMMLRYHKLRREDSEKAPFQYEVKLVNKSGEERIALLQVKMIPGTKQSVVSMLDITEQKQTEKKEAQQQQLSKAINRCQKSFIFNQDLRLIFDNLLTNIIELTDSEYGFIGEVLFTTEGQPYLKIYAITNIACSDETRKFYDENSKKWLELHNLKTLFGYTLSTGEPVISNDPLHDSRRGGLPKGHPPLKAYLGLPIKFLDKMIAMVGIANRPGGYDNELINFLQPLLNTIGYLVGAYHNKREAKQAEDALRESEAINRALVNHLPHRIFIKDTKSFYITCNYNYAKDLGITPEDIIGKDDFDFYPAELAEAYRADDKEVITLGITKDIEERYLLQGEEKWVHTIKVPYRDANNNIIGVLGIFEDITDRKRSEDAMKESENRLQGIFRAAPSGIGVVRDRILLEVNERVCEMTGFTPDELIGKSSRILYPSQKEFEYVGEEKYRQIAEKSIGTVETKWMKKDGSVIDVLLSSTPVDVKDKSKGVIFTVLDITERKQAENALREKEREVSTLLSNLPGMAYRCLNDKNWTMLFVSNGCYELTGYLPEDLINNKKISFNDLILEEYQAYLWEKWQKLIQEKKLPFEDEYQIRTASGEIKWVWEKGIGVFNENGELLFLEGYIQDITERKRAEEDLRQASINWSKTFDAIKDGIALLDANQRIINSNKAFLKFIDKTQEEAISGHCFKYIHGTDGPIEGCPFVRMKHSKQRETMEMRINSEICQVSVDPILDENRNLIGAVHIISDITDRKRMEKALIESEESYRTLFEDHSAVKLLIDPDTGNIIDANKAAGNFYGWSREELKQMKIQQINTLSPEEIKKEMEKARTLKKTHFEFRHRLSDGSIRDVRVFSSKVEIKGKDYLHSIIHDVTKEKELEAQLYQAQKLESIGKLAGGIAHDFNNMLNVILGYSEMILNKLHQQDPLRQDVLKIIEAGKRSMSLTQQLLAFSRKQILQPKILNINESLRAIEEILRRLIGENIELTMALAEDISNVKADQGQIEQVIMNLVVNARDAMPYGGKLIIETTNVVLDEDYVKTHATVDPGDYVMIAVTDTGSGMGKEILSQLFEPFFTTKEKGKGTGLGLSTVYGIVKQSGGHIWVYSEPGKGSTFKIYLPAVSDTQTEAKEVKKEAEGAEIKGGGQHILIVEDEPSLQDLFKTMLTILGYQVTVAGNGGEALLLVEEKGIKPDLVITDVIMPIMNGKILVERLRRNHPDIKALYMSGYTDNAIAHYGVLDAGTPFIQKPFNMQELSLKIKKLLDNP